IRLGKVIGVTESGLEERVIDVLKRFKLPTKLNGIDPKSLIPYFYIDKKATDTSLSFIIPIKIGEVKEYKDIKTEILGGILR
ncbi:MAG: hypothetical protein ACP5RW_07030, partial [bacterium]